MNLLKFFKWTSFKNISKRKHLFDYFENVPKFYVSIKQQANYYEILETRKTASQQEIQENYLKLAKIYHPDIYKGSDSERFKQIKQAYDTLKKPALRRQYDQQIGGKNESEFGNMNPGAQDNQTQNDSDSTTNKQKSNKDSQFMYTGQVDQFQIEEEYEKFIKQPIQNPPESIIVQQDPYLAQLNVEDRSRKQFVDFKNNQDLYVLKFSHQQTFSEATQDTIDMINEKATKTGTVHEHLYQQFVEKSFQWRVLALFLFIIIGIPFSHSIYYRKQGIIQIRTQREEILNEIDREREIADLHNRMIFQSQEDEE